MVVDSLISLVLPLLLEGLCLLLFLSAWAPSPWTHGFIGDLFKLSLRLSAMLPRLSALSWPYIILLLLSLLAGLSLYFTLPRGVQEESLWNQLSDWWVGMENTHPWINEAEAMVPWLVVALMVAGLWLAASQLRRKAFHIVLILALALVVWTVFLRPQPQPIKGTHSLKETLRVRTGSRLLDPLVNDIYVMPDVLAWCMLGVGLILLYRWLYQVNSRQEMQLVELEGLRDESGVRSPHLEQLLSRCLMRGAPHMPSRLPGRPLDNWRVLVERLAEGEAGWQTKLAVLALHIVAPSSGLRAGATVRAPIPKQSKPAEVDIEVSDVRTQQTLMSQTISGQTLEEATERAAYSIIESLMDACHGLPDWMLWKEKDGSALQLYWRGVDRLQAINVGGSEAPQKVLQEAASAIQQAVRKTQGNAIARLQLAELMEARGQFTEAIEIYLAIIDHHPRMLDAWYRLARVCANAPKWYPALSHSEPSRHSLLQTIAHSSVVRRFRLGALPRGENDFQTALYFLRLASAILRWLAWVARWWAFIWVLKSTGDRRHLTRALLWPPLSRLAFARQVSTAAGVVHLRRIQLKEQTETPDASPPDIQDYLEVARTLEKEASRATRQRREGWGQVHYNLARFFACAMDSFPEPPKHDEMVLRAIVNLDLSARDPRGPLAPGHLWWLFVDSEFQRLRTHAAFGDWVRVSLVRG